MNNKNKFYVTNYNIVTPYFKSDVQCKIMVAADIHYHPHVSPDLFKLIVKYAEDSNPDFIIMPGDQIETINFIDDNNSKKFFENIIRKLSLIAPVIMIPGNHEIQDFSPVNFKNRLKVEKNIFNEKAIKYFEGLNKINNVYFLNNEKIIINGVTFLGFNPSVSSYLKINDKKTEDEFIEDYLKSGLKIAEDGYNILITHSPLQMISSRVYNSVPEFKNIDLVITGHLHDGYLPKIFDNSLGKTNVGLFVTPLVAPYPGVVCRGVRDFGRGYLFVSQGYRKYTADLAITNAFEKIVANDIELLMISKNDIKKFNVLEERPFKK